MEDPISIAGIGHQGTPVAWPEEGDFKLVHDSIKPPVWSHSEEPNLSESSLAGWAAVLGFAALTLGSLGLATRALTAHPPNWIQTN